MDKNVSPYYDDGVEQFTTKDYKDLLFNPGRPLQARELSQMQTMSNEQLKKNLDQIYKDGSIIDGVVFTTDIVGVKCYITPGVFYWNGRVYDVVEQETAFDVTGTVIFGLEILEEVISSTEDTALNDPAFGTPNYDLEGADRLKQTWTFVNISALAAAAVQTEEVWKLAHPGCVELWSVTDGKLFREAVVDEYSQLGKDLARRTFDESGHYLVKGMNITTKDIIVEDEGVIGTTHFRVNISSGKAYVKGYEIWYKHLESFELPKASTTSEFLNQNITYLTGTTDYNLTELYSSGITSVSGDVQITNMSINHSGGVGSSDLFTDMNAPFTTYQNVDLSSVVIYPNDGQPATNPFNESSNGSDGDYILVGNTIDWSPAPGDQTEPAGTYFVSFTYRKEFVEGTDWTFEESATINDTMLVRWTETGDLPINGTIFYVDSEYYLARTDIIHIDVDGNPVFTLGEPVHWTVNQKPDENPDFLALGLIKSSPNLGAGFSTITNFNYKRQTMRELFNLKNRVSDIEYNQSELALEAEARGSELPTDLKGIFVDNFETWLKVDVNHPDFKCALGNIDGQLTKVCEYGMHPVLYGSDTLTQVERTMDGTTPINSLTKLGETNSFTQPFKTKVMNLNPYTFISHGGTANVVPRIDSWIDEEIINLANVDRRDITAPVITNVENNVFFEVGGTDSVTETVISNQSVTNMTNSVITRTQTVQENIETKARLITLAVSGLGWSANSRIDVYFNGKLVPATPTGNTGTNTDGDGTHLNVIDHDGFADHETVTGTITVPAGTDTGEHVITIVDIDLTHEGSALFTSRGIDRIITNRMNTTETFTTQQTTNIRRNQVIRVEPPPPPPPPPAPPAPIPPPVPAPIEVDNSWRWERSMGGNNGGEGGDPIAQSFVFTTGKTFSAIDVFFKSQSYDTDAWLEIGYLVNGYPAQNTVFHHQTIPFGSVTTSPNGDTGGPQNDGSTRIDFTKPIYIPANARFFITMGSSSDEYYAYVSELGAVDLPTQKVVTTNPYINGVFFQSSNNNTWSAFQNLDLACTLHEGVYEATGSVVTENITGISAARFRFEVEAVVPTSCLIKYYYSVNNAVVSWVQFNPGDFVALNALATQLRFKMDFYGTGSVTPYIDPTSYNLLTQSWNVDLDDNYYTARTVVNVPEFNNLRLIYDAYLPAGCSVDVEYTVDGSAWYACADTPDPILGISENYDRYDFTRDITLESTGVPNDGSAGLANETEFRTRILLNNGGNGFVTPVVKNLRWIMKI
jgi:hypothetical protein